MTHPKRLLFLAAAYVAGLALTIANLPAQLLAGASMGNSSEAEGGEGGDNCSNCDIACV